MLVRREVTQPWRAVEELEFMIVSWRCRSLLVQFVKVVLLLLSCQAHRQFILLKSTSTFAKSLPPGFLRRRKSPSGFTRASQRKRATPWTSGRRRRSTAKLSITNQPLSTSIPPHKSAKMLLGMKKFPVKVGE